MDWPYARVLAEAVAGPFLASAAFRSGLVTLRRTRDGEYEPSTAALAREQEERLRLRAGGVSLEVLRQARDFVWFGSSDDGSAAPATSVSLLELLQRAGQPPLNEESSVAERAHRERWLSLALPRELLVAAAKVREHPLREIAIPDDLAVLLSQGVAQVHCHLSACLSFPALWTHLMATAGSRQIDELRLPKADTPLGGVVPFINWLVTAALTRLTLAAFLRAKDRGDENAGRGLAAFLNRVPFTDPLDRVDHLNTLRALNCGCVPVTGALSRPALRRFMRQRSTLQDCRSLWNLAQADPMASYFPSREPQGTTADPEWAETFFCNAAMRYLQERGTENDPNFEVLFWQYQRVRCATFRFITQEAGTRGLDWFTRFFKRISPLRKGLGSDVRMDSVIRHSVPLGGRASDCKIEVRIAPAEQWSEISRDLRQIGGTQLEPSSVHCCKKESESAQRGVILHFQKDGPETIAERPGRLAGIDGFGLEYVRFGSIFRKRQREANAVSALLHAQPAILRLLRGLDVCGRELTQPTWLLLPLLLRLRRESQELASSPQGISSRLQRLGMTIHAGEDFRTLLEGLRRIHEPIEFGLLQQRDRIGHAVALGIDARAWCRENSVAYQPAEERLEDILWLSESGVLCHLSRSVRERLMDRFWLLAQRIYALPRVMNPDYVRRMLMQARRLRHDPTLLANWNYPELNLAPEHPTEHSAADFLLRYLTDHGVWRRGQEPVKISTKEECEAIEKAQRTVQSKVRALELTIEANPTSNLLLAELGAIDQHPMFRLAPVSRQRWFKPRYRIALSDDDPLTFATSLLDEYRHTYFAILRQGYSEAAAICWLKKRRKDAIDAAFFIDESLRGRQRKTGA